MSSLDVHSFGQGFSILLKRYRREVKGWTQQELAHKSGLKIRTIQDLETAQKAIALNFYIGVTGPVTYKNAEVKRQIIRQLPLESLLIETDSPFLTPVPYRGKRNEPAFVAHIADKIAEIHLTTREQIAEITSSNAARLFGWGG